MNINIVETVTDLEAWFTDTAKAATETIKRLAVYNTCPIQEDQTIRSWRTGSLLGRLLN
jgi:hypothetical protein